MLYLPPHEQTDLCIIGIDPGSETLGVCELRFTPQNYQVTAIKPFTFHASKLEFNLQFFEVHGNRLQRIFALQQALTHLFTQLRPSVIGSESPFMSIRRPQAYGALVEVVSAIQQAVVNYNPYQSLHMVEPPRVKNAVGAKGNADKDAVRSAMSQNVEIMSTLQTPLSSLDEHSVDATAVAYSILQSYRTPTFVDMSTQVAPFSY